jgi:acyl-CoA-binding protein
MRAAGSDGDDSRRDYGSLKRPRRVRRDIVERYRWAEWAKERGRSEKQREKERREFKDADANPTCRDLLCDEGRR